MASTALDTTGFEGGINKLNTTANTAVNNIQSKLKTIGSGLTNVGQNLSTSVTLPIVAIGGALLKVASDAEETTAKFDTVFGDLAVETRAFADEQADALNRSSTSLQGYLASIQDTLVPLGFAREDAADLSKEVVLLAEDLASFNNLPTAQVLASIQSGIVGNVENFRQFGVVANQASINQELLNAGVEGGIKNATEQQKAQARLNILIAGTTDAQGDALRTADSFANQTRGLTSALETLAIELGNKVLPVATRFVTFVTNLITRLSSLPDPVQNVILVVAALAAALGPVLIVVGQIITAVSTILPLLPALGTAFAALTGPIGLVVAAVALLVTAFVTDFGGVRTKTLEVLSAIREGFNFFIIGVTTFAADVKTAFTNIKDSIVSTFTNIDLVQIGKDIIAGLVTGLKDSVSLRSPIWSPLAIRPR